MVFPIFNADLTTFTVFLNCQDIVDVLLVFEVLFAVDATVFFVAGFWDYAWVDQSGCKPEDIQVDQDYQMDCEKYVCLLEAAQQDQHYSRHYVDQNNDRYAQDFFIRHSILFGGITRKG